MGHGRTRGSGIRRILEDARAGSKRQCQRDGGEEPGEAAPQIEAQAAGSQTDCISHRLICHWISYRTTQVIAETRRQPAGDKRSLRHLISCLLLTVY